MFANLFSRLKRFNIYSSSSTLNNEYELKNERISTRIFIVLLVLAILIIIIYTAQVTVTRTIDVKEPSYEQFQLLSSKHPETLKCPCNNVAIQHEDFIGLKPQFHQLCTSHWIKQDWIDYLRPSIDTYVSDDFSYTGALIFQTLASFCHLANETVLNALQTFGSTRFITADILAKDRFEKQVNTIIENFQLSTEFLSYLTVNIIHILTQTNQLASGLFSNARLTELSPFNIGLFKPRGFNNDSCFCESLASCVDVLTLTNRQEVTSMFSIPGLYRGCYLTQAVLQSTMECFYRNSCIVTIQDFLQTSRQDAVPSLPLNPSVKSRFNVTSTIDQLIAKAMVEEWIENVSYVEYFNQCDVSSCTYLIASKLNIIYIVTTLIALVGGLAKVLRILIHPIVKFIRRRFVPPPTLAIDVRKYETN